MKFVSVTKAKFDALETTWSQTRWTLVYSPPNHHGGPALRGKTDPSHEIVAMDCDWAARRQRPGTMYLHIDHSKMVYVLETHHLLHRGKSTRDLDQRHQAHHSENNSGDRGQRPGQFLLWCA